MTQAAGGPPVVRPAPGLEAPSLLDCWRMLDREKWLIAGVTLAVTVIAIVASFLMTPVYRSEALLSVVAEDKGGGLSSLAGEFGGLAAMVGVNLGTAETMRNEAIALLQSRALTDAFIVDFELLPVLFDDDWDAENQRWDVDDPQEIPTLREAFKKFDEDIRGVSENAKTGLVTLSIEWRDREQAAVWVAELVRRANNEMRRRAIDESSRSLKFLDEQARKTGILEVQQAIYKLMESEMKTMTMANVREEYAFRVIDPAVISDADEEAWPNKPLIAAVAAVLGLMLGLLVAFVRDLRRRAAGSI